MSHGVGHELDGAVHLPSLERPEEITSLVVEFVRRAAAATTPSDQPA